jgi:phosphoserine phosphatase
LIDDLRIRHCRANSFEIVDGKLTGKVKGAIIDRAAKANALKDFARIETIPIDATIAVGDGANDLDMIETAGYGIAYRAKPKVQEKADGVLNTRYLDSILYLI